MNNRPALFCWAPILALSLVTLAATTPVAGAEVNTFRTNLTERWITNVVEVRIPTNRFVNEVRTNWVARMVTNIVDVYATNWQVQTLTNIVPVSANRTVRVTEYQTNWNTLMRTNHVTVDAARTNFVERLQTNWQTFTLTNWETVLVVKTNWVLRPLTNVVQIDLTSNPPVGTPIVEEPKAVETSSPVEQPKAAGAELVSAAGGATLSDALTFDVTCGARQLAKNVAQVRLNVHWKADPAAAVQVQQWRVESENGAILCTSQEREFRRELPVGRYRVEVKAQKDAKSRPLVAKTILSLTGADAVIQPLASARR